MNIKKKKRKENPSHDETNCTNVQLNHYFHGHCNLFSKKATLNNQTKLTLSLNKLWVFKNFHLVRQVTLSNEMQQFQASITEKL